MTPEQIEELGPAFADYLQPFLFCCDYTQTSHLLEVYCKGLLSDLPRKSAEPIALAAGTAVRTLQEFLKDHAWSHAAVRDALQQHLAAALGALPADDTGTVGVIDETATVKKGAKTPGVQRQWCGERGKAENCVVTVHLAVARGRYKALVDADLFLPQSWGADRDRCRAAGVPEEVGYRPKWRLALRQVCDALAAGIALSWLTFDAAYGDKPGFLRGLDALGVPYVGEVPRSLRCGGAPGAPLGLRLRVGFTRWNVEHALRLSKTEIGLRHFEGRSYTGLMRHLMLCLVTLAFVAGQAAGLRGEKPGGDGGAGVPGPELGVPGVAGGVAGDEPVAVHVRGHLLSPAA